MPDYIITAAIFKFKMAAGYLVDSDGYPAAYATRLHIDLYNNYIKLQVCRFWCFYHNMHNPTKK